MSYLRNSKEDEGIFKEEVDKKLNDKKILFLGLTQTGKTSIIKTVFEGRTHEDTESLVATVRLERKKHKFKDHNIYSIDIGGQISYLEEVIEVTKEQIFSQIYAMIFVIEIANVGSYTLSRQYLLRCIRNAYQFSNDPKIYVFAHKMDLITEEYRKEALNVFKRYFDLEQLESVELFSTSIYDDSTIKAVEKILK